MDRKICCNEALRGETGAQGWQHSIAAVGRMALSNYLLQTIIANIFFIGFAIWIFQMVLSTIWLKYFTFGPFEWLWRSLTYRKFQPFRRSSSL